ncbi:MAG: FmdB family transcriptional regulator [Actinobacteria bacterium]|nr:FmdB family transcriptional regulator [Actinomycetota bacterium]
MPTYEYACKTCDQHVEVVQSFTDEPLTTCEACGGTLRRVIHAAGIMFKGSGFYSTDRRAASSLRPSRRRGTRGGRRRRLPGPPGTTCARRPRASSCRPAKAVGGRRGAQPRGQARSGDRTDSCSTRCRRTSICRIAGRRCAS